MLRREPSRQNNHLYKILLYYAHVCSTGLEIISFSFKFSDPNCYDVLVTMNHEITLKVIGKTETGYQNSQKYKLIKH